MYTAHYNIYDIAGAIDGELRLVNAPDQIITDLLTDSRQLTQPEGHIFFAIVSERNNGHKYIPELIRKGLKNFVCSEMPDLLSDYTGINVIIVADALEAIQNLAIHHRKKFNIPVVGITGSNGKTIVKEWLYRLMNDEVKVVANPKSFNSQLGVPLSVWNIENFHELGIFEAGIDQPGEMHQLKDIIRPNIGIFTNIGQAHSSNFKNMEEKTAEKMILFREVHKLICCADHEIIISAAIQQKIPVFSWGKHPDADVLVLEIDKKGQTSHISVKLKNTTQHHIAGSLLNFEIPFSDDASIENAMHCLTFLLSEGWPETAITARLNRLHALEMRLKLHEGIHNCTIINDAYSLDINSLGIALRFLAQQNQHLRKTIILSDFEQAGMLADKLYAEAGKMIKTAGISRLIGIGPKIIKQRSVFDCESIFFDTTLDFIENFPFSDFQNESILIKGARIFEFERIHHALQQKSHETILEINLNALVHNLNYFRSICKAGTKIMAMVKASSYGSGSFEIANALQFHQTDYLAVAYTDEGVELRKAGISIPIMVMNPEEAGFDAMLRYNLEPEIYSFRLLNNFYKAFNNYPGIHKAGIHLKMDTGMHRLGFLPEDTPELLSILKTLKGLTIKSVFSHLAASDDPEHDSFTHQQIERFRMLTEKIQNGLGYSFLRHILNTAGIIRFPEAAFDMVRAGIGLYGVGHDEITDNQLQNVNTFKSVISQIKIVKKNDTIGYNRAGKIMKDTRIGIVPVGYADGLSRVLSNGNITFFVHGKNVEVIGNICMDMCMVDLSNVVAEEGDAITIFSSATDIKKMALAAKTIPYEILTGISGRVKRIYYQE
ncbi:MAG: bifunctional UDP-N-acetylmuramoyl-tripeptide:D-alanyl-D-alanine ligase/alanine racemase [Bacteroidales bacterium]|nr:bifunctional UDP-N-acetylmuramoyl-tripeptide:D-alanyl-D-alanine ligase/alanine racemase [Bacteroidales bacterium]